jgi:hypothetical protein
MLLNLKNADPVTKIQLWVLLVFGQQLTVISEGSTVVLLGKGLVSSLFNT